jgi:diaminopimelate epimerase
MRETKMHGCGNSFVLMDLIEDYSQVPKNHELADIIKANIDSRRAKGDAFAPDGYLLVLPSDRHDFTMKYFDIDRSSREPVHAGMCGNGIRCFSRYAYETHSGKSGMDIMTDDGLKRVQVIGDQIRVNMGPPREYQKLGAKAHFVNSSLAHVVYFLDVMDLYNEFHRSILTTRKGCMSIMLRLGKVECLYSHTSLVWTT